MKLDSCVVKRFLEHNLDIVLPRHEDIDRLHQIIIVELNNNIFTNESKQFYISVMQRLYDEQQVEGIILGCTGKIIRKEKSHFDRVRMGFF